ncbi:ATP synthase E chain [Musa troglodytarum]|uniref:ATP synthase E chain n=1 Tax=Musa troglodytarum TaxID=320322 RepID=A0A9E7F424_9LILI|nr:ATP synthase E chain [Musa troglodytarum]
MKSNGSARKAACRASLLLGFSLSTRFSFPHFPSSAPSMAMPGPYSGVSTLAFVARASAFAFGVVYGSVKLSYLQAKLGSRLRQSITRRRRQKATTEEQNVVCGDSLTA